METGFYYLQTRYYDPEAGRFLNADAFKYLGADGVVDVIVYVSAALMLEWALLELMDDFEEWFEDTFLGG